MVSTIFITGTSSGIGLAAAKLFYEKGWNVVATMRTPDKDTQLKHLSPERMLILRLDVQDQSTIGPCVEAAIAKFTRIDVLLNNAGYGQTGIFEALPREKIQEQFGVNLFGLMDVTRAILSHFRSNKSGGIINVSSGAGVFGFPMFSIYNASKFALEGFTESLSYELGSQNIFVKSVVPLGGIAETNFGDRSMASLMSPPSSMPEYGPIVTKAWKTYEGMLPEITTTSDDVAQQIYLAATDGTNKLRYFIGSDAQDFLDIRYGSKNDEEYMKRMRAVFDN